jgi:hypothetical protein
VKIRVNQSKSNLPVSSSGWLRCELDGRTTMFAYVQICSLISAYFRFPAEKSDSSDDTSPGIQGVLRFHFSNHFGFRLKQ